jgi:hypothetical protein
MSGRRVSSWVFPSLGLGPDDIIVTMRDASPDRADFERLHPSLGGYLVNAWISLHESRALLEELWLELTGEAVSLGAHPTPFEARVGPVVAALAEERLLLWGPIRAGVTAPAVFPEQGGGTDRPQPAVRTTWIEIMLVDDEGAPVGGEEYRLTLPDGAVVSGRLDERGFARIDGIEAGLCDVTFPRIDGREWGRT